MLKTRRLAILLLGIVVAGVNGEDVSVCLADNCFDEWVVCNADMVCSMWLKQGTDWSAFEVVAQLNNKNIQITPLYECGKAPCATSKTYSSKVQTAAPKCSSYGKNCETCVQNGCTWEGTVCSDYCSLQDTEAKLGCRTTTEQCQISYDPNKAYNGQSGYTCTRNEDCAPDETCNSYGMCAIMPSVYCMYDTDCQRGMVCRAGGCTPSGSSSGRFCIFDDDCSYGYACRTGSCVPFGGGGPGGGRCNYDNECPRGMACYNYYCYWDPGYNNRGNTYAAARATDVMTMSALEDSTIDADADDQVAQMFGSITSSSSASDVGGGISGLVGGMNGLVGRGSTSFAAGVSFDVDVNPVVTTTDSSSGGVTPAVSSTAGAFEIQKYQQENAYKDEAAPSVVRPPQPQFLSVHKRTPTSISLVWAAADQGFQCETQVYRVAYRELGTPHTNLAFFEEGVTTSRKAYITVTDMKPNTSYFFQVTAYHSSYAFHGQSSEAASITTRTKRIPQGKRAKKEGKAAKKGKKGGPNARSVKKQKKAAGN